MNEPQEVPSRLLIPCRHPTVLLDPVDEPLRQVALLIKMLVILSLENPILPRRDHRGRSAGLDGRNELIPVISLICDHCISIVTFDQCSALIDVGLLSPGQDQLDRVAQPVYSDVQLGREAAARASQGLVGAPLLPSRRRAGGPGSRCCRGSATPSQGPSAPRRPGARRPWRTSDRTASRPNSNARSVRGGHARGPRSWRSRGRRRRRDGCLWRSRLGRRLGRGGVLRSAPRVHLLSNDGTWLSARSAWKREL